MTHVMITIPEEYGDSERVIRETKRCLCDKYGGVTSISGADGGWIDDEGELIEDTVTVIVTSCVAEPFDVHHFTSLLETIRTDLGQDAILGSVFDGPHYMIDGASSATKRLSQYETKE